MILLTNDAWSAKRAHFNESFDAVLLFGIVDVTVTAEDIRLIRCTILSIIIRRKPMVIADGKEGPSSLYWGAIGLNLSGKDIAGEERNELRILR